MLLASLPPGVTIPVHHDTGYWVSRSHRIHVPIIVPDGGSRILFCVGGDGGGGGEDPNAVRINLDEGRVFEMNNQQKHSVSNCSKDYRVHLILDYVDEGFDFVAQQTTHVPLVRGETLVQTRRTIDREVSERAEWSGAEWSGVEWSGVERGTKLNSN